MVRGGKERKVEKGGKNGRKIRVRKESGQEKAKQIDIWTEWKREIGKNGL
jgi:hypothetical protein